MDTQLAVDTPEGESAAFSVSKVHCKPTGKVSDRGRPMCVHGEMLKNGSKDGLQKWSCPETRHRPERTRCGATDLTGIGGRPICRHGLEMLPNGTRTDGSQKWTCAVTRAASLVAAGRRKRKGAPPEPSQNGNGKVSGTYGIADLLPA